MSLVGRWCTWRILPSLVHEHILNHGLACRSVEIFESILGAEHPETLDARDILSTPSTARAVEPAAEPTLGPAADVGWAENRKQADVECRDTAFQNESVSASQPDSAATVLASS